MSVCKELNNYNNYPWMLIEKCSHPKFDGAIYRHDATSRENKLSLVQLENSVRRNECLSCLAHFKHGIVIRNCRFHFALMKYSSSLVDESWRVI